MVLPFADCPPPLGECGTGRDRPLARRRRLAGFARVACRRQLAGFARVARRRRRFHLKVMTTSYIPLNMRKNLKAKRMPPGSFARLGAGR